MRYGFLVHKNAMAYGAIAADRIFPIKHKDKMNWASISTSRPSESTTYRQGTFLWA